MRHSLFLVSAFLLVSATALAHGVHRQGNRSISFDDEGAAADCSAMRVKFDGDRVPVVTENVAVGNLRSLRVRSERNGGVRVIGSGGSGYSVRACKAVAPTTDVGQVRVSLNGDEVSASGPENDDWVVYFIVETPRNATLDVSSTDGPIGVSDFNGTLTARAKNSPLSVKDSSGTITASTVNGPISIDGGSGNVKLTATNGPLSVKLDGSFWDGALAASTQNGPVSLKLPRGYRSGVVVESLGHGPVSCRAERCAESRVREDDDDRLRRIELGSGPAAVHLSTVNGPVSVKDLD